MFQPGSGRNERARELRYAIKPFDGGLSRRKHPVTMRYSMGMAAGAKAEGEVEEKAGAAVPRTVGAAAERYM